MKENNDARLSEEEEEAFFRSFMQKVAAEEGRRALEENERLKADPNFTVPETLWQKAMEVIGGD